MRLRTITGIALALLLTLSGTAAQGAADTSLMAPPTASAPAACHFGQCQAIAKSTGVQCRHCVSKQGDLYCWQHK